MRLQGMSNSVPNIRRRTLDLKRRIAESAATARTRRILIAEPRPPAWPERVLRDPILEPVDKVVWIVLRQSAVRKQFPGYARIASAANVSSKSTVSRAIAILRATRWLARCGSRAPQGGNRGATPDARRSAGVVVYIVHETPLPVPDTQFLDSGYLAFLERAQAHPHARVRKVVQDILASLQFAADQRIRMSGNAR